MGRGRAPCCEKVGLNKGSWTPEEDMRLIAYIQRHGHANWRALPKQAGLLRCGKSCRLRWINYLRPDIKRGNFTKEEEDTIIRLHAMLGNKWSKIASCLPGRTDNEIKNVWNTHLKKRLAQIKDRNVQENKPEDVRPSSPSISESMSCSSTLCDSNKSEETNAAADIQMNETRDPNGEDDHGFDTFDKIEIPVEPNLDLWEDLMSDSSVFVQFDKGGEMLDTIILPVNESQTLSSSSCSSVSYENKKTELVITEGICENLNDDQSNMNWLACLEEELELWSSSDHDIQQLLENSSVIEMEKDPVSSYFQGGITAGSSSSPSPLELVDFRCL